MSARHTDPPEDQPLAVIPAADPVSGQALMTAGAGFRPLPETTRTVAAHVGDRSPALFRGLAGDWPAVGTWSLPHIASLAPDLAVKLVHGNREADATVFSWSTLGTYVESLGHVDPDTPRPYLKEFDLLKIFPGLREDLRQDRLFPPGVITSCSAWIGPAGARTGLHYDLLDNVAVQIVGRKRFYLAPPGSVERRGALSKKYDRWARLAAVAAEDLARDQDAEDVLFAVDLHPGDVLFVPAHWWHEVVNVDASLLLSGFFGPKASVVSTWVLEGARHGLHRLRLLGKGGCTCHQS